MSSARIVRWSAYAVAFTAAGLLVVCIALLPVVAQPPAIAFTVVAGLLGLSSVVIGLIVTRRRPRNIVGLLLTLNGLVPVWMVAGDLYVLAAQQRPGLLPVSSFFVTAQIGSWMFIYVPAAMLMLVFPDGRLLTARWRIVTVGLIVVPLAFTYLAGMDATAFVPPFQNVTPAWGTASQGVLIAGVLGLLPVFLGLLIAAAVSVVVRYRRGTDPVKRAQVKWFALGALFLPCTLLLCWISYLFLGTPDLAMAGLAATYIAIPASIAIAVLRHDLYDVDKAISATITYGLLTLSVLAFYTLASAIAGLTVGGQSALAAAAATAICAAALSPLRHRLQATVDRRFYPLRQAALSALDDLRSRSRHGQAQPEDLQDVLRQALRDPGLLIGYPLGDSEDFVDAAGQSLVLLDQQRQTPVMAGGEQIGVLVHSPALSAALMREVAAASAQQVELVRLRMRLANALHDVELSRARLLRAGYAERRRLERDLHDGAQQRLVSLGMTLRLGQRQLRGGEVDVDGLFDQAVAELGTAVAELRQLAHGLRPASLDDGLDTALRMLARNVPLPVAVDVRIGQIPEDVATTVYYVACEAITNAVKHSGAGAISLKLEHGQEQLTLRVSDDGRGGARFGNGLYGLSDRVAAAGGNLRMVSPQGQGTVVEAVLPCGS